MSVVPAGTAALAAIALLAAILNLWIFALRRSDRGHLWLGVAAFGLVLTVVPTVQLYGSQSAAEAIALRRLLLLGLLVHTVGFVRFCERLLDVSLRRIERVGSATLVFLSVASFVPGLTFSGAPIVRPLLGTSYVDAEVTPFGATVLLVFVATTLRLFVLFRRYAGARGATPSGVPAAAGLWLVCALADMASGAGLVELPSLFPLGQLGFVLAFTASRIRHFVSAMTRAEARAALLERLVEQRTRALREKELQLAKGEPWATAGTLAAGLAHEINNPVAFVLANLNHLQALHKEEGSEAEIEEVLLETQEGVARLRVIVDELLRLARTGTRVSEPVDLARVVASALPLVRHEAREGIRVDADLAATTLVQGDAGQLGQVVLNLLQNAIHALAAGGRGGHVRVSLTSRGDRVELAVEDDGPGIPEDVAPRIFEPFFTTKAHGTGLGLAVTREIVGRHGGAITAESGARGARFCVSLPALPGAVAGTS